MVIQKKKNKFAILMISALLSLMGTQGWADAEPGKVLIAKYQGMISAMGARYFERVLKQAQAEQVGAVVFELDTPGGLMEPMRSMIQAMLACKVPVAVYVYPQGGRAASAGTFITLGADIAAMAPNTNIGAAHPVDGQGAALEEKIINDAVSTIRSLAEGNGRNADWAESAVRLSKSINDSEAIKLRVVDLTAKDVNDLLTQINGRTIKRLGTVLRTAQAPIEPIEPNWIEILFMQMADPTLAYVFFLVGLSALIFEVTHPGVIFPGVAGVICLVVAFISFGSLPVHYGALALLAFGIFLFILEAVVFSHGVSSLGGVAALVIGSLLLYDSSLPFFHVSYGVMTATIAFLTLFFLAVIRRAIRALHRPALKDNQRLVGAKGTALTDLKPEGTVRVKAEEWSAVAENGEIEARMGIEVVEVEGLKLRVRAIR